MNLWLSRPVYPHLKVESNCESKPENIQKTNENIKESTSSCCAEFQSFRSNLIELLDVWRNDKTFFSFGLQHETLRKSLADANQLERKFIEK